MQNVFLLDKVTPDANETHRTALTVAEIERELKREFKLALIGIGGFYRSNGYIRLNLPKNCLLHAYKNQHGLIAGILCQPLDTEDKYFLLTSNGKTDGAKAARMLPADQEFFARHEISLFETSDI